MVFLSQGLDGCRPFLPAVVIAEFHHLGVGAIFDRRLTRRGGWISFQRQSNSSSMFLAGWSGSFAST
jgi:hypothetical protein